VELQALVEQILADKILTRAEQETLNQAILADSKVSAEEMEQLQRIMDLIIEGQLRVVD